MKSRERRWRFLKLNGFGSHCERWVVKGRASNAPLSTAIISVHNVLGNFIAYSSNLRGLKRYGFWLIADCSSLKLTLIRFLRKYPFGMFFHCLGNRPAIQSNGKVTP